MTKLVHSNVITLVVHTAIRYARAQTSWLFPSHTRTSMARTTSTLHHNMRSHCLRLIFGKAQFHQHTRHISFKGRSSRIAFLCLCREHILCYRTAALKSIIPNIIRTQLTTQSLANHGRHGFYLIRLQQTHKQSLYLLFWNLQIPFKGAQHMRWSISTICIHMLKGVEYIQYHLIARESIMGICTTIGIHRFHCIGIRCPQIICIIHHTIGYILLNNTQHHLINHLLLLMRIRHIRIIRFQLIAQVPVREQSHRLLPKLLTLLRTQGMHHNIIPRNIILRLAQCLRISRKHTAWHTRMEYITHASISPLLARPICTKAVLFF